MAQINLNTNESKLFKAVLSEMLNYGEYPYFNFDESIPEGMSVAEAKGYFGSLKKKGLVDVVDDPDSYFTNLVTCWDIVDYLNATSGNKWWEHMSNDDYADKLIRMFVTCSD